MIEHLNLQNKAFPAGKALFAIAISEKNTDKAAASLIDDTFEGLGELKTGILGHMLEL